MCAAFSKNEIRTQISPDLLEHCDSVEAQWYFSFVPAEVSKQWLSFSNSEVGLYIWAASQATDTCIAIKQHHTQAACLLVAVCRISPPHSMNCVELFVQAGMGSRTGSHWPLCTSCSTSVNSHM